mmetsp:Transcript_18321/g.40070  ORF Transcript_18321/g.40070 Transcript_18321/m.40070 type:complete len:601 (+) Transcript_18321:53-1855(+)
MRNPSQIHLVHALLVFVCHNLGSFAQTLRSAGLNDALVGEGLQLLQIDASKLKVAENEKAAAKKKPHVLFILADDLGFANVGYVREEYGVPSEEVQTPVIDGLAQVGVKLSRMYAHHMCSPTRVAIQSGRAPIHANVANAPLYSHNPEDPLGGFAGMPRNMTGIAEVLQRGGYRTHYVGKWDAGAATPEHTPAGRGYETSLNFFGHTNDPWTFANDGMKCDSKPLLDLFEMDETTPFPGRPASRLQNPESCRHPGPRKECIYEDQIFADRVQEIIRQHTSAEPFFIFWAPRVAHAPLEVPDQELQEFSFIDFPKRQEYSAMVRWLDKRIGGVVQLLMEQKMYRDTLIIFSSDNGGPLGSGANNYPLRGGKHSNFDGGVRVPAFVSGGFVPENRRGSWHSGLMAAWDWYATLAGLAQVDHRDHRAFKSGLPLTDSFDLWPALSTWGTDSPRATLVLGNTKGGYHGRHYGDTVVGGIIFPPYKLLLGVSAGYREHLGVWSSPNAPNSSSFDSINSLEEPVCGRSPENGCLFNVWGDEGEHHNLAKSNPELFLKLLAMANEEQKTVYSPKRGQEGDDERFQASCSTGSTEVLQGNLFMRPWLA